MGSSSSKPTKTTAGTSDDVGEGVAWKMIQTGDPSDKSLLVEIPRPKPASLGDHDVLVEMGAAALNPIDYKLATGKLAIMTSPPFVSGFDFAGTVVEAGPDSGFQPGQKVFGDLPNMKDASPYVRRPKANFLSLTSTTT